MASAPALRHRALWLAIGWGIAAGIAWLSLAPTPLALPLDEGDKLGHLFAYGVLMYWFCQLYAAPGTRLAYALGFAAMGVALEFAQNATGERSFDALDMLANAAGAVMGWLVARASRANLLARLESALRRPRA